MLISPASENNDPPYVDHWKFSEEKLAIYIEYLQVVKTSAVHQCNIPDKWKHYGIQWGIHLK